MKERIAQRARDLGFEACRFTNAAPPESAPRLQQWLGDGKHGVMGYLQSNAGKRADPRLVLAGARSIITLAAGYGEVLRPLGAPASWPAGCGDSPAGMPALPGAVQAKPAGIVARYARHADYHKVLAAPLKQLTDFISQLGGAEARSLWYVDTGPFLERDLAQRAGLGFIGKHTNLISRELGNWIFLSEIITTLELEPDAPEKNRCGSCYRCLTACPTQAITAPFQLDARRCISYLTIEFKGSIPLEFRRAIGSRIYGCDDCLAACPWNRFAREGRLMKAHGRADLAAPDLIELLSLDEPGFRSRFAGTPILRATRRGLLRNVCVALGNARDPIALPVLARAAADPDPLIAEHARWAMDEIAQESSC